MYIIHAISPPDAWSLATSAIIKQGNKIGDIQEILNVIIEIQPDGKLNRGFNKNFDEKFDDLFRKHFDDDRIDHASSVTFIRPTKNGIIPNRRSYEYLGKWFKTYWGRMVAWQNKFNQIENVISILEKGHNVKRCEIMVYEPLRDARSMYSQPCLLAIDLKPRDGELHLTAIFRSQRVSKSGYADYLSLYNLNKFLAQETGLNQGPTTVIANSCHIMSSGPERKNSIALINDLKKI